ncbi:MAG: glycosyltransferase family 2 protein [Dysgonomonas sp.]|nr:glycosyltransferase family 2 protein [Dysgonomonas sp.]
MKISIITTTFNSATTLRNTIESVLCQSYPNIEYIIIDGASTDDTMSIIKEYEPLFAGRMRWISEPDKGMYDAMNKGIAMATGEVVGILNSDDFYTSDNVIETLIRELEISEVDAVYGDIHYVKDGDLSKCVRHYSSANFRRWKMRMGWMPAHPSFYCRRSVYEKYGTFDCSFKIGADFENLLRLIFVNRIQTKYVPINCVTMRIGGVSTSGLSSHKQIFRDHMQAYKKNAVYSNWLLESIRYIEKVWDILLQKIRNQ